MKYYIECSSYFEIAYFAPEWLDINIVNDILSMDLDDTDEVPEECYTIFNLLTPDIFVNFRKGKEKLSPKPEIFNRFDKETMKKLIIEWKKNKGQERLAEEIEENLDFLMDSASIADIIE